MEIAFTTGFDLESYAFLAFNMRTRRFTLGLPLGLATPVDTGTGVSVTVLSDGGSALDSIVNDIGALAVVKYDENGVFEKVVEMVVYGTDSFDEVGTLFEGLLSRSPTFIPDGLGDEAQSLQRIGRGCNGTDFEWSTLTQSSEGVLNDGQEVSCP